VVVSVIAGAVRGVFNAPLTAAAAIAPAAGAGIAAATGGYPALFSVLAATAAVGAALAVTSPTPGGLGHGTGNVRKRPRAAGQASRRGG
jgi:hypothetical protein